MVSILSSILTLKVYNDVSKWSIFILKIFDTLGKSSSIMNQKQLGQKEINGLVTDNSANFSSNITTKLSTTPENLLDTTKKSQYPINSSDSTTLKQEDVSESSMGLFSKTTKKSSVARKKLRTTTKIFRVPISETSSTLYSSLAGIESTTTLPNTTKEQKSTNNIRSQYSTAFDTSTASPNSSSKIELSSTDSSEMMTSGNH